MQDPMALLTSSAAKSHAERVDKAWFKQSTTNTSQRKSGSQRAAFARFTSYAKSGGSISAADSAVNVADAADDTSSLPGTIPSTDHDGAETFW